MAEENVVYVGNKMVMSYVLAVVTQFSKNVKEVSVKARGRAICKAVDVVEIVKNRFMPEVKVKDIKIGTDEVVGEGGLPIRLSSIEIILQK